MGLCAYCPTGEDIIKTGHVNQGTTNNQAELKSILSILMLNGNNRWKYWHDSVEEKGDSYLVMNFLIGEWSSGLNGN